MTTEITTSFAGQVGVHPNIPRIKTTATYDEITTAGWLNKFISQGYQFYPSDSVLINYANNTTQYFSLSFNGDQITLTPQAQGIVAPVIAGNVPVFSNTKGTLEDSGLTFADANGNYIATTTSGPSKTGKIAYYANDNGFLNAEPDVEAIRVLYSGIDHPDQNSNVFWIGVTVTAAELNTGSVLIYPPATMTARYVIHDIMMNYSSENFSGGGGDRDLAITDGTTNYTIIPDTNLQTLANARWGSTAVPFPASVSAQTLTAVNQNLRAVYSGGTNNYTDGATEIWVCLERLI